MRVNIILRIIALLLLLPGLTLILGNQGWLETAEEWFALTDNWLPIHAQVDWL